MTINEQSTENIIKYAVISSLFILMMALFVMLIEKYVRENSHSYIQENSQFNYYDNIHETRHLLEQNIQQYPDNHLYEVPQIHRKQQSQKMTPVKSRMRTNSVSSVNSESIITDSKIKNYVMSVNGPLSFNSTSVTSSPSFSYINSHHSTPQMTPKLAPQKSPYLTPYSTPRLAPVKRIRSNTDISIDVLDHESFLVDETKNDIIKHMEFLSLSDEEDILSDNETQLSQQTDSQLQEPMFYDDLILRLPLAVKQLEEQIERQAEKSIETELTYENSNDKIEEIYSEIDSEKKTK